MDVYGWGRYPTISAELLAPVDAKSMAGIVNRLQQPASIIPRGAGRSYGDSSLALQILSSRFLDSFLAVDEANATIRCGAGVTLDEILKICIPRGWFPMVMPGTKFVSVGGAIAADIHGKNHHRDGSFCDHIVEFSLLLASGETVNCGKTENSELFFATCGGMGLTGVILDATIRFEKVSSVLIRQQSISASNLDDCLQSLDEHNDAKYSVAWLDCLATGDALGRSIIYLGEHCEGDSATTKLKHTRRHRLSVPLNMPAFLLNRFSMGLFNSCYFNLKKGRPSMTSINYDNYFFPLDNIQHWNRLYGAKGFLQYQFVIPLESAAEGISQVLSKVSSAGKGSFLSVLKRFGEANKNFLSFPKAGYTLTLDFKYEKNLFPLLDELDRIVVDHGGRIYLAKDARMQEDVFKSSYENWDKFLEIKNRVDPNQLFASLQSDRLGLTTNAQR